MSLRTATQSATAPGRPRSGGGQARKLANERWEAVCRRDRAADGTFVVAVRTR